MDYINIVIKAVEYIEEHLHDKDVNKTVYKHVYVSKFHFHRVFMFVTKLTLGQYIKRRRFTEVSKMLLETDDTLIQIAFSVGYNSHESFTRAFKEHYGLTPSEYRKRGEVQTFYILEPYQSKNIEFVFNQLKEPVIEMREAVTVCGIVGQSSLNTPTLDALWSDFRSKVDLTIGGPAYTVWMESDLELEDLKDDVEYKCFLGVEASNKKLKKELQKQVIPGGLYARFDIVNNFEHVFMVYAYIYFEWLKKSAYEFNNDMIIEEYDKDFSYENNQGKMSILIPIIEKQ